MHLGKCYSECADDSYKRKIKLDFAYLGLLASFITDVALIEAKTINQKMIKLEDGNVQGLLVKYEIFNAIFFIIYVFAINYEFIRKIKLRKYQEE